MIKLETGQKYLKKKTIWILTKAWYTWLDLTWVLSTYLETAPLLESAGEGLDGTGPKSPGFVGRVGISLG